MSSTPITFAWNGEVMEPTQRFRALANKQFVVGEMYPLIVQESRTRETHNHYFAAIEDAWNNLPETLAPAFPTSEHLRKYALIKSGFCDHRSIACASKAEALRVAAFVKPMDTYAIVIASEATVSVYTAKSQSTRAMGKAVFQDSKQKVLDVLSGMIGVEVGTLSANAGQAA